MIDMQKSLDKIIEGCTEIKARIQEIENLISSGGFDYIIEALNSKVKSQSVETNQNFEISPIGVLPKSPTDFESLEKALKSSKWPQAVEPRLICDFSKDEDKRERARGIIDLMVEEVLGPEKYHDASGKEVSNPGKKFLDYGCEHGYCAFTAAEDGANVSVGYDLTTNSDWRNLKNPNLIFTTSFDEVKKNAPYDVVLLYDVIDHSINEDPVDIMKKIHSVLKDSGKVYVRCHPFISKYATHLYNVVNKAFIHLVFKPEELQAMFGTSGIPTRKIIHPIATYNEIFEKSGFKKDDERILRDEIDDFFYMPLIKQRILEITEKQEIPDFQMKQIWLDYILSKK